MKNIYLFGLLILLLLASPVFAIEIPPNTWVKMNPSGDPSAVSDAGNNGDGIPAGRVWFPMVYHSGVKKTIVYGGGAGGGCGFGYINDIWAYDFPTDSWKQVRPVGPDYGNPANWPPGQDNQAMAYDSINEFMWILGGTCTGGFGYYDYSSNSFTEVNLNNGPPSNVLMPGFAYGDGKLVAFSGEAGGGLEETYVFDISTQTWTNSIPAPSPIGRGGIEEVMVYDPVYKKFVIFGGNSGNDETWEYDVATNTWDETTPINSPSPRHHNAMVYDSKHGVIIMHGGIGNTDTWAYDVRTKEWTQIANNGPPRFLHGMSYDADNDVVIIFSGNECYSPCPTFKDVWAFRYVPSGSPTPDTTPPTISITSPSTGDSVSNTIIFSASASDNVGVLGVQFKLDGSNLGSEDTGYPYSISLDTTTAVNGSHILTAVARDAAGYSSTAANISVTVSNSGQPPSINQIDIPLKTWVALPNPEDAKGLGSHGVKHFRLAHNPDDGRIYFQGGDVGSMGGIQDLFSLDIKERFDDVNNINAGWTLEYPACGYAGDVQPRNPDQVGWTYDTKRQIFWMMPGYQGLQPQSCTQLSTLNKGKIMAFNPVTKKWIDESRRDVDGGDTLGIGENNAFSQYDPVTDTIIQFQLTNVKIYNINSDSWEIIPLAGTSREINGVDVDPKGVASWGSGYQAIDVKNRHIYIISAEENKLYRYHIDPKKIEYLTETYIPVTPTSGQAPDRNFPLWDSVNEVLLWPYVPENSGYGMRLFIYHPDTKSWEEDAMLQPDGYDIRGNAFIFDPYQNVLMGMGGSNVPINPYYFFYRYGNGDGTTPTYQCSDGLDNDSDGLTDYPEDSGCLSASDNDEYNIPDTTPPGIISVNSSGIPTKVIIVFSEPVEQSSSEYIQNYYINNGITISSALLGADLKTVTLTTSSHQKNTSYTLTINNVRDRASIPNTIPDNTQKSYTYTDRLLISNLSVYSGRAYEVISEGLQGGATVYIDRTYTFTQIPSSLQNSTYMKTANDDKNSTGSSFLTFDVNQDVTVYVGHNDNITIKPAWLQGFVDTGVNITTQAIITDTFSLFRKDFPAGVVAIGGNNSGGGSGSMYTVSIVGQGNVITPDTTPPSPPGKLRRSN